jgi:hypothetical protein
MNHTDALRLRLSNERSRLVYAKSRGERDLRAVWVAQVEKEIAAESSFSPQCTLTDDELLAELLAGNTP